MQKQHDPAGLWTCSYQDYEYGSEGTLDECIDFVYNYITADIECMEGIPESRRIRLIQQRLREVRSQCLLEGEADRNEDGYYWWTISCEGT